MPPECAVTAPEPELYSPLLDHFADDRSHEGEFAQLGWPCGEEAEEAEVEAAIGGNFEALTDSERPLFDLLNTVLDCCSPDVCANHSLPPGSG